MRSRTRKLRVKRAQSTCSRTTADVTESEAPFMWIYLELGVMEKAVLLTVRGLTGHPQTRSLGGVGHLGSVMWR